MNRNSISTIFQNIRLSCWVKILFTLFFLQGFYSMYGQMNLQGSVVVIDKELQDKKIDYLSVNQGTYIYSNTENKHKTKGKTIINIAIKSSKQKDFKKKNITTQKYPNTNSVKHYTHNKSEVFFNPSISPGFVCAGNNYQVKNSSVLAKNELSEIFYFSQNIKSLPVHYLETQYDYSKKHRIRPPPLLI